MNVRCQYGHCQALKVLVELLHEDRAQILQPLTHTPAALLWMLCIKPRSRLAQGYFFNIALTLPF